MHLIQDENGNVCPHSHEHTHTHTHTYEHTHAHSHEHGHEEEHAHTHGEEPCEKGCSGCGGHEHSHGTAEPVSDQDKMAALLDYMLKHNEHHAAELDQMAGKLQSSGKTAAAEQLKKAVDEFQKGNLYLSLALSSVKENR